MNKQISLSIFFPTYNEEDNIARTIESTVRTAEASPYINDYEIIVVNDGSSDATRRIAEALAETYPAVRVVNHRRNMGYGAALQTGIRESKKEYVFFTDADLQFDIIELNALLLHIPEYHVVIGYRSPRRDPLLRLLNAKGWNVLNRILFGLKIRDIDCAFKIFRRDLVRGMPVASKGAMINAEILIRLERAGTSIKQVPVSHLPRVAGSATGAKPSVILRAFREMMLLYGGELGSATQKQAIKFIGVGILNTLLDLGIYVFLTRGTTLLASEPVTAKFFSFLAGTLTSLVLNRSWTFGITSRITVPEIFRFYATVSVALGVNIASMYILVHILGVYDLIALGIATLITFSASFTLSKLWVFRKQNAGELSGSEGEWAHENL